MIAEAGKFNIKFAIIVLLMILILRNVSYSSDTTNQNAPFIGEIEIENIKGRHSHTYPQIISSNNMLIYSDGNNHPLLAFDTKSLEKKWELDLNISYIFLPEKDNEYFIACDYEKKNNLYLYKIDIKTGEVVWKARGMGPASRSSKDFLLLDDFLVIASWNSLSIHSFESGILLKEYQYDMANSKVHDFIKKVQNNDFEWDSTLAVWAIDDKLIILNTKTQEIVSIVQPKENLRYTDQLPDGYKGLGMEVYKLSQEPFPIRYLLSSRYSRGIHDFYYYDLINNKILWELERGTIFDYDFFGDDIFISNYKGITCIDRFTGKKKWENVKRKGDITSIKFSDNIVYHYIKGEIDALNLDDGSILWSDSLGSWTRHPPVISDDRVFVLYQGDDRDNNFIRIYSHKKTVEMLK